MKRLVSLLLIFILVFALAVPAFAAESYSVSPVRYGIYDDKFIFEGVAYSSDTYSALDAPSFMYLNGDQLLIFSRSSGASPYVTFDNNGILCYYDGSFYTMLTYNVAADNSLSFVKASTLKKFEPGLSDYESFRSHFLVSNHVIFYSDSSVFMNAEPVIYYDVKDSGSHVFDDHDYFILIVVLLFAVVLLLAIFVFVR